MGSEMCIRDSHIAVLQEVFEAANLDADSPNPETIIAGIFGAYDVIWDFRYILRDDFAAVLDADEPVLQTARLINGFLDTWTEGRIQHAHDHGILHIEADRMEDISEIILVIGRYWLDFSGKKYPDADSAALRLKGLRHIFTVLSPYLTDEAQGLISGRLQA